MKIGINGFGRIGRLVFRALWDRADIEITHINEIAGDSNAAAHLLEFDSVHGRWAKDIKVNEEEIIIDGKKLAYTSFKNYLDVPWEKSSVDIILECTGKNKKPDKLNPYFDSLGMKRVIVACPVKGIVAAAITTIHDVTNTQVPVDFYKSDLRRARGCMQSLIPTTTGSAKAIAEIFPELKGKLNGHAVRVPLLNGSLTDAVFELNKEVTTEQVNMALKEASETYLKGILGYEERPLVSADYVNDSRSSIVDSLSTMVVNSNLLKIYAWYDNEWGYSCRLADLTEYVIKKEI